MNWLAELVGEDEIALIRPNVGGRDPLHALPLAMRLQGIQCHAVDRHPASALACLGWTDVLVAAHGRQGLDDRQRATSEVHVLPSKAEHLTSTHTRRCQEDESHRESLPRECFEEPLDLFGRPRPLLGPRRGDSASRCSWVAADKTEPLGVRQCPTQHDVTIANRLRCQRSPAGTPARKQRCVERFDLQRRQRENDGLIWPHFGGVATV